MPTHLLVGEKSFKILSTTNILLLFCSNIETPLSYELIPSLIATLVWFLT